MNSKIKVPKHILRKRRNHFKSVKKYLKYQLTQRYGLDHIECVLCGNIENLHIHHIIPLEEGGSNNLPNMTILCRDCHFFVHEYHQHEYPSLIRRLLGMGEYLTW